VGWARLTGLTLAAALIAVLPAAAAAKPKAKTKVTLVATPFLLPAGMSDDKADVLSSCPPGTTLLSGGVVVGDTVVPGPPELDVDIYKSAPSGNAWFVRHDNDSQTPLQPSAQAICLKNRLKVTGADGKPKAVTKVTQVHAPLTIPSDADPATQGVAQIDVACPKGSTVVGGGATFASTSFATDIQLQESGPRGNGWHVRYRNDDTVADSATASAICLKSRLKLKRGPDNDKARSKVLVGTQPVSVPGAAIGAGRVRFDLACPKGTTVVGGGANLNSALPPATTDVQLEESGQQGNGWRVTFDNDNAAAHAASVHAQCLKNKLKVK
jgi:hypothetical protein